MNNAAKNSQILATNLSNLHNYFNSLIKLLLYYFNLYLAQFFNILTKLFFPHNNKTTL